MAFVIPEGLHEDLMPLAWLVGKWGGRGQGEWPGSEPFQFTQEITFRHDGRPFLEYTSRSWLIDNDGEMIKPAAGETGYWRVKPGNILEVLVAHNIGLVESWVGQHQGAKIQLEFDGAVLSPSAKQIQGGSRLYGLVEGQLFLAYDMQAMGKDLQPHVWASLERQVER